MTHLEKSLAFKMSMKPLDPLFPLALGSYPYVNMTLLYLTHTVYTSHKIPFTLDIVKRDLRFRYTYLSFLDIHEHD